MGLDSGGDMPKESYNCHMRVALTSSEFSVLRQFALILISALLAATFPLTCIAQSAKKSPADSTSEVREGIQLAVKGLCERAIPLLRSSVQRVSEKKLRYDAAMAMAECGMSVDDESAAVEALGLLHREFPNDPAVLYRAAHFYSELATRAAEKLVATDPTSAEAQELKAESLESQGKLDEAAAEYRKILQQYPQEPGIHYRLGRIFLAGTPSAASIADAKKEFEEELKIDPTAAAAEFELGDLARQAQDWNDAIDHFSRASQLDAGFSEAYLGLGLSLNAAGKNAQAIAPLLKYEKMEPGDPAGHYQLAIAYARTGRKQDAQREIALQQKAEKATPPSGSQNAREPGGS